MLKLIAKYPLAFVLAIVFHIVAAGAFLLNLEPSYKPVVGGKPADVVQATLIEEPNRQAELDKLKAIAERKSQAELDRLKKLEREAEVAKKARLKEQERLKALKRKQELAKKKAEQKRKQELAKKKKLAQERKKTEEKRKKAEEKLKKEEKAAKQARQREKEAKRKREAEAKRKKADERRKKAEADRKRAEDSARKASEARRLAEADRERQRQIDLENKRLKDARNAKVINRYVGLIARQVKNSWRKPATATGGMSCDVDVTMMPSGDILKVKARNCIGGGLFKRSVEDAVYAAAPLALPPDRSLFKHFREITFKFNPN